MAGEGVSREVKLTIVTEGEEEARRKIDDIIKNVNSTKMGEVDIPYKTPAPKAPEPKEDRSVILQTSLKQVALEIKKVASELNKLQKLSRTPEVEGQILNKKEELKKARMNARSMREELSEIKAGPQPTLPSPTPKTPTPRVSADKEAAKALKEQERLAREEAKEKAREFLMQIKFKKMRQAEQDAANAELLKVQKEIKKKEELNKKEILKNIDTKQMSGFSDEMIEAADSFREQFKDEAEKLSDSFKNIDTDQMGDIFEDMVSAADDMRKTYEKQKKTADNSDNSMRKSLTGMLIWMHTFRVFGEYSAVLKSQFTMLGNAVGMIMNQFLIPLYPLITGMTVALYQLANIVRIVFKTLGTLPSLLVALALATMVIVKLFWGTWLSLSAFNAALNASTAAITANTVANGANTAGKGAGIMSTLAANPVAVGAGIGVAAVVLLEKQFKVLTNAYKAGQDFRKNVLNPLFGWIRSIWNGFWAILNGIWKKIVEIWQGFVKWFTDIWDGFVKWLGGIWETLVKVWDFLVKAFTDVLKWLGDIFKGISDWLINIGKAIWDLLPPFIQEALMGIWGILKQLYNLLVPKEVTNASKDPARALNPGGSIVTIGEILWDKLNPKVPQREPAINPPQSGKQSITPQAGEKSISVTVNNTFNGISDAKQIGETIGNDLLRILKNQNNTVNF